MDNLPSDLRTWPYGNEGDEVDLSGDQIVDAALRVNAEAEGVELSDELRAEGMKKMEERIDWWLEEGGIE